MTELGIRDPRVLTALAADRLRQFVRLMCSLYTYWYTAVCRVTECNYAARFSIFGVIRRTWLGPKVVVVGAQDQLC